MISLSVVFLPFLCLIGLCFFGVHGTLLTSILCQRVQVPVAPTAVGVSINYEIDAYACRMLDRNVRHSF